MNESEKLYSRRQLMQMALGFGGLAVSGGSSALALFTAIHARAFTRSEFWR